MSNYVEINGDPDEIRARGAVLAAQGQSFDTKARELVSQIQGLEAGAPWGGDKYGKQFLDNGQGGGYNAPTETADESGGTVPFNQYVQNGAGDVGPQVAQTGSAIEHAMTGYQFADVDNQTDIAAVQE